VSEGFGLEQERAGELEQVLGRYTKVATKKFLALTYRP
jgi:hypothetical protein